MSDARHRPSPHRLLLTLGLVVMVAVAALLLLQLRHQRRIRAEREELARAAQLGPRVLVAKVETSPGSRATVLPGDVRAFNEVQLTAKLSGFLQRIHVDVGSRVKEGEVLAELESPETQQQVRSAYADYVNKQHLAVRARNLAKKDYVSQQDAESAEASARVAKANWDQARDLLDYTILRAPFDGVITGRFADPGALMQVGTPLVELRDPDRLRVRVYAGQDVAPFLKVGDPVEIVQDELPSHVIRAWVSRVAGGLDPASRTMLTEIWLDNRMAKLVPGVYVHVTLHVQTPVLPVVPIEALLTRGGTLMVAVVENGRAHLRRVEVGLNDGKRVQIRSGLSPGQIVVLNPPTELREGAPVQAVTAPQPSSAPARNARTPAPK